jgi:hypothetical protein
MSELTLFETLKPADNIYCHQDFLEQLDGYRSQPIGKRASLLLPRLYFERFCDGKRLFHVVTYSGLLREMLQMDASLFSDRLLRNKFRNDLLPHPVRSVHGRSTTTRSTKKCTVVELRKVIAERPENLLLKVMTPAEKQRSRRSAWHARSPN